MSRLDCNLLGVGVYGLGYRALKILLTIFHLYIVVINFIGRGNHSNQKKQQTFYKSMTNFIN